MTEAVETTAPTRSRRALRIFIWAVIALLVAFVVSWFVAAKNPSLAQAGMSWQSDVFVENEPTSTFDDELPQWTAWDQPDGAWASVVIKNDRPYAVTIAPGADLPAQLVKIGAFDPVTTSTAMDPARRDSVPSLRLAPGDYAIVMLRVSDRCAELSAGSATGSDTALVKITTLGVTEPYEVQFPATYMAGTTNGHGADPTCPQP